MTSLAPFTIHLFGFSSLLAGIATLYDPAQSLEMLNLPYDAIPAVRGNALAAIAMGIYYSLAGYQDNIAFFYATVPMRGLTTVVFWMQGWYVPAIWEGVGALATGLALLWARWQDKQKMA